MKTHRAQLILTGLVAALAVAVRQPLFALLAVAAYAVLVMALRPQTSRCFVTLTVSEILSDTLEAFKVMLPALRMFSSDMSAERVAFGQEVIAHLPTVPTVFDYTASTGYRTNAQAARDLLTDVPIKINQWKHVPIKLVESDIVGDRSQNYLKTINNSGYALAKAVCDHALGMASRGNFSQSTTASIANTSRDTLGAVRKALNTQKAGSPRFMLASSDFMESLEQDVRITSKDFYGQQTGGQAYAILRNVAGFSEILEYPDFPLTAVGTFTAATSNTCTLARHPFSNGDRVRVSSSTTLPAGLAAATNYFIISADRAAGTFELSATSGGAAVDITDTGTGTHTIARYEELSAFAGDSRAIGIATRLPLDGAELARTLGIPVNMKMEIVQDEETGLAFCGFGEFNQDTHDVHVTTTVMFGAVAGKQGGSSAALVDYAGHRVVTA